MSSAQFVLDSQQISQLLTRMSMQVLMGVENFVESSKFCQKFKFLRAFSVIYAGIKGSTKCLGDPILDGRNEILLLVKGVKFRVGFQKYALKLKYQLRFYRENSRKMQSFRKKLKANIGRLGGFGTQGQKCFEGIYRNILCFQ